MNSISFPLYKNAVVLRISEEEFFHTQGPEYRRKVERIIEHPVPNEDIESYKRGLAQLEELRNNKFFYEGGPEEGAYMEEPSGRREYIYAETHDEWLTRCRAIRASKGGTSD